MFWPLFVTVTAFEKLAALTKKLAAETKSDFITTFFLDWPSKKVFKHKILGIK